MLQEQLDILISGKLESFVPSPTGQLLLDGGFMTTTIR
jgi:hypothetical protein